MRAACYLISGVETIEEIRHAWLLKLIAKHRTIAALNEALGRARNDATLSQIKNGAPSSNGEPRSMGSKLAREIEAKLGIERGTLDHSPNISPEARAFAAAYQGLPDKVRMHLQEAMHLAQMAMGQPSDQARKAPGNAASQ